MLSKANTGSEMKTSKVMAGLLASFLPVSNAYSKIIHDGRCDYLMEDGKIVGSMCSEASAPSIPKINRKINSLFDLEKIVKENKIRPHYGGFKSSTLIKAIISVENPQVEPRAISQAGAVGLMQILPTTAGMNEYSLTHSKTNILQGMEYLDTIYEKHSIKHGKDALKFSLAEYLVGEGNLQGAIEHYNISSWKDLENVIKSGDNPVWARGMKLRDSTGMDVVDYTNSILRNYFKFRSLERK